MPPVDRGSRLVAASNRVQPSHGHPACRGEIAISSWFPSWQSDSGLDSSDAPLDELERVELIRLRAAIKDAKSENAEF